MHVRVLDRRDRAAGGVGEARSEGRSSRASPVLHAAFLLSALIVPLMVVLSIAGLVIDGLYRDGPWGAQAFRGADLVTLVVAVPMLTASLVATMRGSRRATAVWVGMLGYSVYNYAFYIFGAVFNDVFLLHIAVFAMSLYALACALPNVDIAGIGERLRNDRWARWVGGLLVTVGLLQGLLWVFAIVRFAFTGELIAQVPARGQHVIFALDLSLMMPALVIAGVLLSRRSAAGFLLGTAASMLGAVYTLNGLAAAWFQARAGVPGAQAFPPTGLALAASMIVPAAVLWFGSARPRRSRRGTGTRDAPGERAPGAIG